ncbi:glycosyltransferase family 2 protein [Lapidilactobacillus luobeiensis]|uniref:glycosyltransferase family 2 protein n=1 Tax=Lapidilactobacillus luobeiensis TaxID=2950371 RepID=UPI0021C4157F|nr:glycosyltransferase family 2 protein [Lapidilactobacillus luobeiensis]
MTQELISIVLPVYNEHEILPTTIQTLENFVAAQSQTYELIFVDDGSSDYSATIIAHARESFKNIKLVQFSRNFGHQIAITAGIRYASGAAIVVMDADLQDPPEVINAMIEQWHQGYQVVYGKRVQRDGETWFKKTSARLFYRLLARITAVPIPTDTGDFRLIDRQVAEVLKKINEDDPYVRGLISWVGFRQTAVNYERHERLAGQSKYPLRKMMKLALDGITSFSELPLKLATWLGGGLLAIGLLVGLINLVTLDLGGTALIAFLLVSLSGLLLLAIGILGAYLARIFAASRQRPLYIVANTEGFHHPQTSRSMFQNSAEHNNLTSSINLVKRKKLGQ